MTAAELVIVTGLSGAGKSTVLAAFEDLGFYCVDSLPTPIVRGTLDVLRTKGVLRIALGIDVRVGGFLAEATEIIDTLHSTGAWPLTVFFLDASDEALLRRFSSTRRPHPLSLVQASESSRAQALLDGILRERALLAPLKERAGVIWDSSALTVHELRARVLEQFGTGGRVPSLMTSVVSFGFKYGVPIDADMLFDVRFLENPFFIEELREATGLDPAVSDFVQQSPGAGAFLERVVALLEFCLPRFEAERKSYLTIGVGCTGGQHRSVVIAEAIAQALRSGSRMIKVVHRDIRRAAVEGSQTTGPGSNREQGPPTSRTPKGGAP